MSNEQLNTNIYKLDQHVCLQTVSACPRPYDKGGQWRANCVALGGRRRAICAVSGGQRRAVGLFLGGQWRAALVVLGGQGRAARSLSCAP